MNQQQIAELRELKAKAVESRSCTPRGVTTSVIERYEVALDNHADALLDAAERCLKYEEPHQRCAKLEAALQNCQSHVEDIQAMTKTHEEVPQWGWPDYNQQMKTIRRVAGKANAELRAALADGGGKNGH